MDFCGDLPGALARDQGLTDLYDERGLRIAPGGGRLAGQRGPQVRGEEREPLAAPHVQLLVLALDQLVEVEQALDRDRVPADRLELVEGNREDPGYSARPLRHDRRPAD